MLLHTSSASTKLPVKSMSKRLVPFRWVSWLHGMENGVNLIIAVLENGTVKRETRSSARSRLLACFEHIASCFLLTFIG
jgi:hypothetical protein